MKKARVVYTDGRVDDVADVQSVTPPSVECVVYKVVTTRNDKAVVSYVNPDLVATIDVTEA